MYIIEVIPIARSIPKGTLSYFSALDISLGSMVVVPIRNRQIPALVVSSKPAEDERSVIRTSDFSMKKVGEFKSASFLSEAFMKAVKSTADYSASSMGGVLNLLIPKVFLEKPPKEPAHKLELKRIGHHDQLVLQVDDDERFATYRSLIREEFARKHSVFFCVPTAEDVKRFGSILPKGIEDYAYSFYTSLPKKNLIELWTKSLSEKHPILIIATAPFFALPRTDIGTIVVENESSRSYKLSVRPYLDVRTFAEFFAKENQSKLVVGDTFLRTETIYRANQGEFAEFAPMKFRSLTPAKVSVVDMSQYRKTGNGKFEAISAELSELIQESHLSNQNLFIFSARRGYATQVICNDCGTTVLCSKCHSPITLHTTQKGDNEKNFFSCHSCGEKRSAKEYCNKCQSWKLQPLGVAIELVEAELRAKFPLAKVFRVDKDTASTAKQVTKIVATFYASPGSILVGTEMVLPYLDKKIGNTAVASLDALFSIPDFRIHEKILHLILKIRSLAEASCIVQTRMPNERILEYAIKGNLIDFYRGEISMRQSFNYPPFSTLIKLTLSGTRNVVMAEMEKLKPFFDPVEIEIFPAFSEEARGIFSMHALIRLPKGQSIDQTLLEKLLSLPPQFRIAVDPESLL